MFKRFSAIILLFALMFLASCADKPVASENESTAVSASRVALSEKDTDTASKNTNDQNKNPDITASEDKIEHKSEQNTEQKNSFTTPNIPKENKVNKESKKSDKEVKTQAVNNEPIPEISNGISLLSKTSPVSKGYQASITVMGTPNKKFTIEFYKNGMKDPVKQSDLSEKTSNDAGIVTWTFTVPFDCSLGNNMVIIKESGSGNKLQTSINIK